MKRRRDYSVFFEELKGHMIRTRDFSSLGKGGVIRAEIKTIFILNMEGQRTRYLKWIKKTQNSWKEN